jgi:hypothetical protein
MKTLIAGKNVTKVTIAGVLDQWSPAFFDKPFIGEDDNFNYGPDLRVGDTSDKVLTELGVSGATVEQRTDTGTFNIKP